MKSLNRRGKFRSGIPATTPRHRVLPRPKARCRLVRDSSRLIVEADLGDVRHVSVSVKQQAHPLGGDARDSADMDSGWRVSRGYVQPLAMRPTLEPVALDATLFIFLRLAHRLHKHEGIKLLRTVEFDFQPASSSSFRKVKS